MSKRTDPMVSNQSHDKSFEFSYVNYELEESIFGLGSYSEFSVSEISNYCSKNSACHNSSSELESETCNVEFGGESES